MRLSNYTTKILPLVLQIIVAKLYFQNRVYSWLLAEPFLGTIFLYKMKLVVMKSISFRLKDTQKKSYQKQLLSCPFKIGFNERDNPAV